MHFDDDLVDKKRDTYVDTKIVTVRSDVAGVFVIKIIYYQYQHILFSFTIQKNSYILRYKQKKKSEVWQYNFHCFSAKQIWRKMCVTFTYITIKLLLLLNIDRLGNTFFIYR
jgi:hypothetical protein